MLYSENKRSAIVENLLNANLSANKELNNIVQMATEICETQSGQINLLTTTKQYSIFRENCDRTITDIEETFCKFTIMSDEFFEVPDACIDDCFSNNPFVAAAPYIRFYAGMPLKTKCGIRLGSLCVIDTKPSRLNEFQKRTLETLAKQAVTFLELELSLASLKAEKNKVIETEHKLNSIFLSSPTLHIVLDKSFRMTAFNKAAIDIMKALQNTILKQGDSFLPLIQNNQRQVIQNIKKAFSGNQVVWEQHITYDKLGEVYWEMKCSPVYEGKEIITGVSVDAINITESKRQQQQILNHNSIFQKIAFIQSHEVRRPMANIMSLINLLQDKNQDDFDDLIMFLKSEALSLDNKIRNIVSLSNNIGSALEVSII